jgi:hypothetical protein
MTDSLKQQTTTCPIDGILVVDCPHAVCEKCRSTLNVCGGCFRCVECHDDYSDCSDWLIAVEVMVVKGGS